MYVHNKRIKFQVLFENQFPKLLIPYRAIHPVVNIQYRFYDHRINNKGERSYSLEFDEL